MINIDALFNKYNLIQAKYSVANNAQEAVKIANRIGYPVALKIESKDVLHKTDVGGVYLNLYNEKDVRNAFQNIINSINANKPDAEIKGVIVQEMLKKGVEIIIGYNNDITFGPVLMLGLGGIFTEIIKDISFRILPITKKDAEEMVTELRYSNLILKGFRSTPGIEEDLLIDLIFRISKMALEVYKKVESFDINPLIIWNDNYRIVDFKYVMSSKNNKIPSEKSDISYMDNFFDAKSVAVIGASGKLMKFGNYILSSLVFHGYKGKVYPINPNSNNIMGLKTYPSLIDVPNEIELVILSIPLINVSKVLEQCKTKNIHNVIIISGGGKEAGQKELEENIKSKAKENNIRVIGCNCIGAMDGYSRLNSFFYPEGRIDEPECGSISMMSQSGTAGISFLEKIKKFGISKFVSYGNRIDVDEGDLIEFFGQDQKTKVIAAYIEGLSNGIKFYRSAKKIAMNKPIVVYKAGRTQKSSNLSKSHTGYLSGSFQLVSSIFNQAKIISVNSLESLIANSKILSTFKRVNGNKIMVITNGAGAVIQAIDSLDKKGKLKLAVMDNKFKNELRKYLPSYAVIDNIIDLTGSSTDEDYEISIKACLENKNIDIIMVWIMLQNPFISSNIHLLFKKLINISKKPIIIGATGGSYTMKIGDSLENLKIPIFYTVEEWLAAAECVIR